MDRQILAHPDYHARPDEQEAAHGCYDGWHYLGHIFEDENGEHIENIERVPCRRCGAASEKH